MSKSLLNGVNELLKKTDILDSDSGVLSSLTDSGRQVFIDTAVQVFNEIIDELYDESNDSKPKQMREATITLVSGAKSYNLHSSCLSLRTEYGLIDETNNHVISVLGDEGYRQIIHGDLDQDDTGLPTYAAISPIDGRLVFDRTPDANSAGRVYKYRYDRDMFMDAATDTFPFNDKVFRAIIPAAAELWKFYRHQEFAQPIYDRSMSRASSALRIRPKRKTWGKQRSGLNITDPFDDTTVTG